MADMKTLTINGVQYQIVDPNAKDKDWMPTLEELGAVPIARKINDKELSGDVVLSHTDVGAAPADLKTVNAPLMSSIDLLTTADDVTVCPLNAVTYFRAVRPTDGPVVNGDWHVMVRRAHDSDYSRIEVSHVVNGSSYEITKSNGTWGSWVETSASAFAPAGFGYGEAKYLIWWDDSDGTKLENYLDGFFTDINNRDKIYRFTLVDYPACVVAGQGGYADIVCTDMTGGTPQSITIVYYAVDSSDRGMAIATKKKHSGVWCPWEYVNPPMTSGTEYRTTERWNGAPVYTALLDLGTAPNNSTKSMSHPSEIHPARVIGWSGYMVNTDDVSVSLPTISDIMGVHVDNYGISLFTKDDRSNFYVYIKIKYIK